MGAPFIVVDQKNEGTGELEGRELVREILEDLAALDVGQRHALGLAATERRVDGVELVLRGLGRRLLGRGRVAGLGVGRPAVFAQRHAFLAPGLLEIEALAAGAGVLEHVGLEVEGLGLVDVDPEALADLEGLGAQLLVAEAHEVLRRDRVALALDDVDVAEGVVLDARLARVEVHDRLALLVEQGSRHRLLEDEDVRHDVVAADELAGLVRVGVVVAVEDFFPHERAIFHRVHLYPPRALTPHVEALGDEHVGGHLFGVEPGAGATTALFDADLAGIARQEKNTGILGHDGLLPENSACCGEDSACLGTAQVCFIPWRMGVYTESADTPDPIRKI